MKVLYSLVAYLRVDLSQVSTENDDFYRALSTGHVPRFSRPNRGRSVIDKIFGTEMKVTTYTARHSCATVLKRSGAPIEYISESLGHKDLKTTENYLDSFEDEARKEYSKRLTEF